MMFISVLMLIFLFARTSYSINWKAFPSKLINQEANILLLLHVHGTDLPTHLLNYSLISTLSLVSWMLKEKSVTLLATLIVICSRHI